jgi:hypothetical protein
MPSHATTALRLPQTAMNSVMLPPTSPRRGLLPSPLERDPKFLARYERDVMFYDVFWDFERLNILLLGPAAIDLEPHYRSARYRALPSGQSLRPKAHHSAHVQLFSLRAPADTTHIEILFAGTSQQIIVADNHGKFFAGQNLLFTLSQNNDLAWIADWARFHVVNQGVTAVVLFDNKSTLYDPQALEDCLVSVPGLKRVGVVPVPFTYPLADEAVPKNIFWPHFLQPAVITNMFRRYGIAANAILNCDIDELAVPLAGETVFESATRSRSGTVYFRGCWIEPVPNAPRSSGYRHRDFVQVEKGVDVTRGPTNKWALAPDRRWLRKLKVHPNAHVIDNRVKFSRHKPGTAFIAHFKAISNSWKYDRPVLSDTQMALEPQPALQHALEKAFGSD